MVDKVTPVSFADLQDAPGEGNEDLTTRFFKNAALHHLRGMEQLKRILPALSKKQVIEVFLATLQDVDSMIDQDDEEGEKQVKVKLRGRAKDVFLVAQRVRYALFTLFLDSMRRAKSKIDALREQEKEIEEMEKKDG